MYIKSVLDLEEALEGVTDEDSQCSVNCTTTGTMPHKAEGPEVVMEYKTSTSILLPFRVIKEFIRTKCHGVISSQTVFSVTEDMAVEFVVGIFKKVHMGYVELIACRAKHIEREYIFPALEAQAAEEAPTPPNSPFQDYMDRMLRGSIGSTPDIIEEVDTPVQKHRRLKE